MHISVSTIVPSSVIRAVVAMMFGVMLSSMATSVQAEPDSSWATSAFSKASRSSDDAVESRRSNRSGRSGSSKEYARTEFAKPSRLGGPVAERPRPTGGSLSGGISWQASSGCVPGQLRGVLSSLVSNFGGVTVTSTCRSESSNRSAGGAKRSYHLSGEAVDLRVRGASSGAVYAFLSGSGSVGGLKHYGGGLFHIDTGPRRPM